MLRAFGFENGESREEVKEEITPTRRRSSGARIASEPSGLDWRAFAEQGAANHAGNEPPRRWWRGVWRQSVPRNLTRRESLRYEWDAAALANERSLDEAPPRRCDLGRLKADLIPHLMEMVAVVLSAWFSFAIAHFGPKVETQLSWTLVTVLASLYRPSGTEAGADLVEAVLVGALTGGSSRREPRVIPGLGWLTLVALLSGILWCLVKEFEISRGNGGRYGMIAFTSTMSVSLFILMPAHKTSYALIYNRVGKWNSMVRAGQVFRYLAATPTAAFLTRMTKISTGHASPTAGAASAMLLILLIQVIGDGVTRSA